MQEGSYDIDPAPVLDAGYFRYVRVSAESGPSLVIMRRHPKTVTRRLVGYEGLGVQLLCPVLHQDDFFYSCSITDTNVNIWYNKYIRYIFLPIAFV